MHVRAGRIEGRAIDRGVGARTVEADLVGVTLRAAHAGTRIARPREHAPDSARHGRRRVHVNLRIAKLKSRLPAAPRRVVERGILPARGLRALAVFPRRALRDRVRRHRRRGWRKIRRARRAAALRARRPVCRPGRAAVAIAFRERRPAAIGRDWPRALVAIGQLVHRAIVVIEQPQGVAGVIQCPRERSERAGKARGRFRHEQIPIRRDHRSRRERIIRPARDPPVRQVHVHTHHIEKLDPLACLADTRGVVVDFIEDDHRIIRRQRAKRRGQTGGEGKQEKSEFHRWGWEWRGTIRRRVRHATENQTPAPGQTDRGKTLSVTRPG